MITAIRRAFLHTQITNNSSTLRIPLIRYIIGWPLLFGLITLPFTLNGALSYVAHQTQQIFWISIPLQTFSNLPEAFYTKLPISQYFWFELLVRWVLISLGCYLLLASIVSMRQKNWSVIAAAFAGLILGMFIITWITWLIWLLGLGIAILEFFKNFFTVIFQWLITTPLIYFFIVIFMLLLGFILFLFATILLENINDINWRRIAFVSTILAFGGVLLWFGMPLLLSTAMPTFLSIGEWWNTYVGPFLVQTLAFITRLLIFLLGLLIALAVVAFLGNQFIDQFRSSMSTGQSIGELFDTSFALGITLAIILLVCYANVDYYNLVNESWSRTVPLLPPIDVVSSSQSLIPPSIRAFLAEVLLGSSLPIFDVSCIIVALFLANCSLLMGLMAGLVPHTWRQIFAFERGLSPILIIIGGILVTIIIMVIDKTFSDRE